MKHKTALAAQVAARNRANSEANKLAVQLAEVFRPMVGKKITCNGGGLTESAKKLLPEFPRTPELNVWHSISTYTLCFAVKVVELEEKWEYSGAHYAEAYVAVGTLAKNSHDLESVNEPCTDRRTDYTEAGVLAARQAVDSAEKAFHDAQLALEPFKRHDW